MVTKEQALKNLIGTAQAALLAARAGMVLGEEYAEQLKKDVANAKKVMTS